MAETIEVWRVESDPRRSLPPDWVEPHWWHTEERGDDYGRRWSVHFLVVPSPSGPVRVNVGGCIARDSHGRVGLCTPETFEAVQRGA